MLPLEFYAENTVLKIMFCFGTDNCFILFACCISYENEMMNFGHVVMNSNESCRDKADM